MDSSVVKWRNPTVYFKRNPIIPWDSDAQYAIIQGKISAACDKWKAVTNINCVFLVPTQSPPVDTPTIWISLSQIQTVDAVTRTPRFRSDGTKSNYCGMIEDQTSNTGKVVPGTYRPFSCATVGWGYVDRSTGVRVSNAAYFIAINKLHIDQDYVYLHEVGHLLGLSHVQSRVDRNSFITLNPNFPSDYSRMSDYAIINTLSGDPNSFDFGSVMAYRFSNHASQNYKDFASNLNEVIGLVRMGASDPLNARFQEWRDLNAKVSGAAFAIKNEIFEANYPMNQSAVYQQGGVSGAYPSPGDVEVVKAFYGPPLVSKATCNFLGNFIPHGSRVGVFKTGQVAGGSKFCEIEPIICNDGVLSGSSTALSCSVGCNLDGQRLKFGEVAQVYSKSKVSAGQSCGTPEMVTCDEDKLNTTIPGFRSCSVAAAVQPSCTLEMIGSNPVASGGMLTLRTRCSNVPAGARVNVNSTKSGVMSRYQIQLNSSGMHEVVINNNSASVAGSYSNNVQVSSSSGVVLHTSNSISFTVSPYVTGGTSGTGGTTQPNVSCLYQWVGATPLPAGEVGRERISCSNVPAGAVVRVVGTKNGVVHPDIVINLVNGTFEYETFNNDPGLAGSYVRHLVVRSSSGAILTQTNNVSVSISPATTCQYNFEGANPVLSGGSGYELVRCSNLPSGGSVKIIGTKDGMPQINTFINLVSNEFRSDFVNNAAALTGTYVRNLYVYNSAGRLVLRTANLQVEVRPYTPSTGGMAASCQHTYTDFGGTRRTINIASGASTDIYNCSYYNLTANSCQGAESLRVSCANGVVSTAGVAGNSCTVQGGEGMNMTFVSFAHGQYQNYCSGYNFVGRKCVNGTMQAEEIIALGGCPDSSGPGDANP